MRYSEKLQSPLWQKRRLEILQRDNFSCQLCGDTQTTLHVHHKEYISSREPWDYPDDNFITYCKYCHALAESFKGDQGQIIAVSKVYSELNGIFFMWSIYNSENSGLVLSIDRFINDEQLLQIIRIKKQSFLEMAALFQTCEKLIENGKRSSNAVVLE